MRGTTTCYLVYIFHDCSHAVPPRTLERGSRRNIGSIVVVAACNAATAVAAIGTRVLKKRRKKNRVPAQALCERVPEPIQSTPETRRKQRQVTDGGWWARGTCLHRPATAGLLELLLYQHLRTALRSCIIPVLLLLLLCLTLIPGNKTVSQDTVRVLLWYTMVYILYRYVITADR